MARPLRIEYPGAWYHVMNRVAGRGIVFRERWTTELFLHLLQDLDQRFSVECHAYCLMGNHYHLLLRTPEPNLGRAMRHFNGLFTQQFNRHLRRDGPLFRGRYKAILVDADSYLLAVSRYIHRNPIEAGLVKKLDSYTPSSYPAYVGRVACPDWLQTRTVLGVLGPRAKPSYYRALVEEGGEDDVNRFFSQERPGAILGSVDFVKRTMRGLKPNREQPKVRSLRRPSIPEILQAVSQAFEVTSADLRHATRSVRNLPRAVAMHLCQTVGQKKLREIAAAFNVSHYATVSVTIARLKQDLDTDRALASKLADIEDTLD